MKIIPTLDRRYSVELEHTGEPVPVYVARFVGDFIGSSASAADTWKIADAHAAKRLAILNGTEVTQ